MLKVLIVDDEAVVRRGIVLGIDWASLGCAVVGEAANGEEGLAAAERQSGLHTLLYLQQYVRITLSRR